MRRWIWTAWAASAGSGYWPRLVIASAQACSWADHSATRLPTTCRMVALGVNVTSRSWNSLETRVNATPSPVSAADFSMLASSSGTTVSARSTRRAHSAAHSGSSVRSPAPRSPSVTRRACSASPRWYAADDSSGRCTSAPPTLPRRTVTSPSVSRMRMASLIDG